MRDHAGHIRAPGARSFSDFCAWQGLSRHYDTKLQGLSRKAGELCAIRGRAEQSPGNANLPIGESRISENLAHLSFPKLAKRFGNAADAETPFPLAHSHAPSRRRFQDFRDIMRQ